MAKKKNNKYNVDGYELQLGTGHTFEFIPEFNYTTHWETDEVGNTRVVHESVNPVKEKKAKKAKKLVAVAPTSSGFNEAGEYVLAGNPQKDDKEAFIPKNYYLTETLTKAIALKAAYTGVNKSQVVRDALKAYLSNELNKLKR